MPCLRWRLRGVRLEGALSFGGARVLEVEQMWAVKLPMVGRFTLPIEPIPSGMVIDVLSYSTLWMAILTLGPLLWHRVVALFRRHRGHCPACGYDLRRLFAAGCPECGWKRCAPGRCT